MVKVLVLGATGYIGNPLCLSLRRDDHTVYGLARSEEKENALANHEILPVIGSIEGKEYLETVKKDNIDLVIDAAGANQGSYDRFPVNDLSPVQVAENEGCPAQPPQLVAWRPALERTILDARDALDSVIIRPALLYGRPSRLWSLWLFPIAEGAATATNVVYVLADTAAQPGLVHVDDVVSAIHLTVAKFRLVNTASGNYPVFDIVSSSEPMRPILEAAAFSLEFKGELIFDGPGDNAFAVTMNTSMRGSSTRARDLLGWVPKHTSMGEEVEIFVAAWKAHQ